jgi:hypothetical protein
MKKMIISISLIFMIILMISDIAFSWNIPNHKKMSEKAVGISQLPDYCENNLGFYFSSKQFQGPAHSEDKWGIEEFANEQNKTATEWIIHGSGAEDEFFGRRNFLRYGKDMRPINHFYNPFWDNDSIYPYPYDDWGNYWLFQEGGLYDDIASGVAGVDLYAGKPLPRWGYDGCPEDPEDPDPPISYFTRSDDNYFSWVYARKYFYAALSGDSLELNGIGGTEGKTNMNENERDRCFALLFRSLGQILHLVQDAGQPEHTRNDAHPLSGMGFAGFWPGFEYYATKYNCTSPSCSSVIPWQSIVKSENPFFDFFDSNRSGGGYSPSTSTGVAEFSNYNFLTKDSIADNLMRDYCEPDCEPYGHYRHRFFTSPRIDENRVVKEKGRVYDTYYYMTGPIIDPLGIYPGNEYKLAKRRWYHNLLVMYGWRDYTTEDPKVWDAYLDILIPRCIGYSAALLNYFFRGTIDITLPEKGVFALTDKDPTTIDPTTQGFDHITLRAQNTSPEGEEMTNGSIELVVKYKIGQEDQFQNNPPDPPDEFHYIVVELPDIYVIPRDTPEEFAFDLTTTQIPLWATDVSLYLIYRGTLGSEDKAVGVGFKDISEPTPIDYFNVMDQVCLYGELLEAGSDNAIALVDANGNGVVDSDEWDVFPHDAEDIYIRFSPVDDPQDATSDYRELNNYYFPYFSPGNYFRIFLLSDYEFNRSATVVYTPVDPRDPCVGFHGEFPRPSHTMSGVYNQTVLGARITSSFHQIRGIDSFFTVLFDNLQYPLDQPCEYW